MGTGAVKPAGSPELLTRLSDLSSEHGNDPLAESLLSLAAFVHTDLETVELSLEQIERPGTVVGLSGRHLLALAGKRLRPLCVALAARIGSGFNGAVLDLAVAVELVHNATLLHDDVVDLSSQRRGATTARSEYGNAASIFAGDWLLVEALRRVHRSGIPGRLESLLSTIEEMIFAESLQLEHRGRLDSGRQVYFRVAEGKTAALFRWAMYSGGRAGGLDEEQCLALDSYGRHLGIAFQVTDDLLDLTGDTQVTGKALFTDLFEGKMTYPLILALERDAELHDLLAETLAEGPEATTSPAVYERVLASLHDTGAVDSCRELASRRASEAIDSLRVLPDRRATRALATVAEATVNRTR
ncbi:MAG: polyprenyl synthetase family protein [Acidobacteria bacterium]|nr:polyprenyl synthetase family protein [Acidobacteriota bacterium]